MIKFLKSTLHLFNRILQAVFYPEKEKDFPWLPVLWISLLVIAGLWLWGYFFNWGDINFNFMDWGEVWAARMQAWNVAIDQNTIPLHMQDLDAMRSVGDRYFAVADMISSPQLILFRWLEVGLYSLVNNWLLFGFATYFLLQIRKRFRLSLFAFTVLFLLFHFNGFIVTHLAVGHLSWGGYYLFPAFVLFLFEVLEGDRSWKWVAKMAFLLFFMFLQGSFHHLVWCFIAMGMLAVFRWRSAFPLIKAVFFSLLLSMPRILPVFTRLSGLQEEMAFLDGYLQGGDILYSMIYNATPAVGMPGKVFDSVLGYWEFDIFTGWVGMFFILAFGIIYLSIWHYHHKSFPYLLIPALGLTFLSIKDNYLKVLFYNQTLTASERVTTRLMGLALVILIILAAIYYQKWANRANKNPLFLLIQISLLVVIARDLVFHTINWSVQNGVIYLPKALRDLSLVQISNHVDPPYTNLLVIGSVITLGTMAFLLWITQKEHRMQSKDGISKVQS